MSVAADGTFVPDLQVTINPVARNVGDSQDLAIVIAGGTPPYRMQRGDGRLPRGRRISTRTSAITGVYEAAGQSRYTIRVSDAGTQMVDVEVIENVGGALAMTVAAAGVQIGSSADVTPSITGGLAPYQVSLVGGQLPLGRRLDGGKIVGTYAAAATFTYSLQVQDAAGARVTVEVTQKVSTPFADPVPTPPSGPGSYTPIPPVTPPSGFALTLNDDPLTLGGEVLTLGA